MNKRILFICLSLSALMISLASCASGNKAGQEEVLNAVKRYNGMLRRTYMEANINLMEGVATKQEISKLVPAILSLQARQNSMMTEQKTFEVRKVSLGDDSAWVQTEETWVYWFQNAKTAEITEPEKTLTYRIKYHLIKENDMWKVDRLEDMD